MRTARAAAARPTTAPDRLAAARPPWPADVVPSHGDAERAVRAVLAGAAEALDERLAARVARDLTELERAAHGAEDDEALAAVRAATALRWRLGAALLGAPGAGPVDQAALAALLAEADGVLAALAAAAKDAAPAFAQAAAAVRKSLVADAVALHHLEHRLARAAAPAPAPGSAPRAAPARPRGDRAAAPRAPLRLPRARVLAALGVAVLAAGGFHLDRWVHRPVRSAAVEGAPQRAIVGQRPSGSAIVSTWDGNPMAEADLERLRAVQRASGKAVREIARGVYAVEAEPRSAGAR
jgi:hypothetical protein